MTNDVLADLHDGRGSESVTLGVIVEWAKAAVGGTDAGVLLLHGNGKTESPVSTSPDVVKAHDLQISHGEGPCLEALQDAGVSSFVISNTATDVRFPKWGPAAAELGFLSVISAVLETRQKRFGSLNVFSDQPNAFTAEDLGVIEIFSHQAARAMAVAEDSADLNRALDTRKLIGRAEGILMERLGIDSDRAFEYLVRQSQTRNIKLRVIADWIVTNRGSKALSDLDL
jgi:GAF domain-containing protein